MLTTRTFISAILAATLLVTPSARATVDEAEVEATFKQLADDDSKVRDAARKKLISFGDEAVPKIQALAEKSNDPETRASVAAILEGIEASSVNGPSLITLDLKDAPAEEAIRQIAKQAHAELPVWPDWVFKQPPVKDKRVTYKAKREPFWKVMKEVLPQLELQVQGHGGGNGRLQISQGQSDAMNGPASINGPFMVIAQSATETNTVNFGQQGKRHSNTSVSLQFFIEPKVKVMGRAWSPVFEEFEDETGRKLFNESEQRDPNASPNRVESHWREPAFQMGISLQNQGQTRSKKIAKLKGFMRILAQTGSSKIEVDDLKNAKGKTFTQDQWTLEVQDFKEAGGQYTVKFNASLKKPDEPFLKLPPGFGGARPAQDQWRQRMDGDEIRLVDANGRALEKAGHSIGSDRNTWSGEISFRRQAGQAGEPVKLIWEFPTEAKELRIPFEFKDLVLP